MTDPAMIEAFGLTRRFGGRVAVDQVDFSVAQGEIFAFLGPNGAGKSTTVRMLTGYLAPSSGNARVAGHDVVTDGVAARRHMGVVPEEANVYADLSVWQNVMLMAELHGIGRRQRTVRGSELLAMFGLADRRDQKGRDLSKGLRQRLMLCAALVSDADVLFLDEPTSGLDVASARIIREVITSLNLGRSMTVFLTTHNIEEAGDLSHRMAIINQGRLAAIDTPQNLRAAVESRRSVEVRFTNGPVAPSDVLEATLATEVVLVADGFRAYTASPGALAQQIATRTAARGIRLASLNTLAPSLEDVFLHITNHGLAPHAGGVHANAS